MKISLLSTPACRPSVKIINYFIENNFNVDSIIIEKKYRRKFSENEKQYRLNHDAFNKLTNKYSLIRRITKTIWDISPIFIKQFIQTNIYFIPIINRFSLRKFAESKGIKTFEVEKHSSQEVRKIWETDHINYALMVSSNWILKEPIISLENTKIINAHSGHLPYHKGLDSIPWSLLNNDKVGLTTHFIDKGIDSGSILKFYELKYAKGDDFNTIKKNVGELQPLAFLDTLKKLGTGDISPKNQDNKHKPHQPISLKRLMELNNKLRYNK